MRTYAKKKIASPKFTGSKVGDSVHENRAADVDTKTRLSGTNRIALDGDNGT